MERSDISTGDPIRPFRRIGQRLPTPTGQPRALSGCRRLRRAAIYGGMIHTHPRPRPPHIVTQRRRIDPTAGQFLDRQRDRQTALAAPAAFQQTDTCLVRQPDSRAELFLRQAQLSPQGSYGQASVRASGGIILRRSAGW
jgi:hypothetical protein